MYIVEIYLIDFTYWNKMLVQIRIDFKRSICFFWVKIVQKSPIDNCTQQMYWINCASAPNRDFQEKIETFV